MISLIIKNMQTRNREIKCYENNQVNKIKELKFIQTYRLWFKYAPARRFVTF